MKKSLFVLACLATTLIYGQTYDAKVNWVNYTEGDTVEADSINVLFELMHLEGATLGEDSLVTLSMGYYFDGVPHGVAFGIAIGYDVGTYASFFAPGDTLTSVGYGPFELPLIAHNAEVCCVFYGEYDGTASISELDTDHSNNVSCFYYKVGEEDSGNSGIHEPENSIGIQSMRFRNGKLLVSIGGNSSDLTADISIYSLSGQVIFNEVANLNAGVTEFTPSVDFSNGIYVVEVKTDLGDFTQKLFLSNQ